MKILIAPDKFKGSIDAKGVCKAIAKGIKSAKPNTTIISKPLADGGEGSLTILKEYFELRKQTIEVQDPLGRPIKATYLTDNKKAYIELSTASGLELLQANERNCIYTSTYGTGELILDAINKGIDEIFLFIGGSATNDGGIGIAEALGYKFLNIDGKQIEPIGENLLHIASIDNSQLKFDKEALNVTVICDVNNPFYGENGAAHIYAKQKGASTKEIIHLDAGLKNLTNCLIQKGYSNISNVAGAGAAGGVGGGAIAFLNATLKSGIQTFLEITQLEKHIVDCDLIITGEGKIDKQSLKGKVLSGVCDLAKKHNKRLIAICGVSDLENTEILELEKIYSIIRNADSLADAIENAEQWLIEIGKEIATSN